MNRSRVVIITRLLIVCVAALLTWAAWPVAALAAPVTELVSVTSSEAQGNGSSSSASVSTDGRFIVFASLATDLVTGDTNAAWDIFIRDRLLGTTERVSVSDSEAQANGHCINPSISADGRYVAFYSVAANLVTGDTNGKKDVFVRDRVLGTTVRASRNTSGTQGNGDSGMPSISADGRYVAFESFATNLVSGDNNGEGHVFVRDLTAGTTTRVSVSSGGTQGNGQSGMPSISADGRYVAFESTATNLVSGDTAKPDVFVRDLRAGTTEKASVNSSETAADNGASAGVISADGRYVAFCSASTNLVTGDTNGWTDIFVRDRTAGTTERVSLNTDDEQGNGASLRPAISANGRYVAFHSAATNLTADSNAKVDVFLRDRQTGTTLRISTSSSMGQGNNDSDNCAISADGLVVAFESDATSLVTGDGNAKQDVFAKVTTGGIVYKSIRGTDRYDTAIRLSQAMLPGGLESDEGLVLAPGETFQEALCGAPLAAAWGGPVLLTPASSLRDDVKAEIERLSPEYVFCIGLSEAVVEAVKDTVFLPYNVFSISGTDVYDMSRKVANKLDEAKDLSGATAIVTIGTNFPDAIGVSPLACGELWPIILTDKPDGSALHPSAAGAFSDLGMTRMLKVGTYAALPAGVTGVGSLSGSDRYVTNRNVVAWALNNTALTCAHIGITTGEKFPDALAAGPYLQHWNTDPDGLLFLSPLTGPLPTVVADEIYANRIAVDMVTFAACIEPVISLVKALLP